MVRLIGEGAHVGNADIEQMTRIICDIGETAADRLHGLDDEDFRPAIG
jgi:hypothetical protein